MPSTINALLGRSALVCLLLLLAVGAQPAPSQPTDGGTTAAGDDLLDLSCYASIQCIHFQVPEYGIASKCIDRQCTCSSNVTAGIVPCRPRRTVMNNFIGTSCPCDLQYTECTAGRCVCAANFVPSQDRRRCEPIIVMLGSACARDSQCQQHSTFSACRVVAVADNATAVVGGRTCQCLENYAPNANSQCQGLVALDVKCSNDAECERRTPNSSCLRAQCACNYGHVPDAEHMKCLRVATYQKECSVDAQCKSMLGPGGRCDRMGLETSVGLCDCEPTDTLVLAVEMGNATRHLCENRKAIDDACTKDADCHNAQDPEPRMMTCYLSQCICDQEAGYEPPGVDEGRYCVASASRSTSDTASLGLTVVGALITAGLLWP